MRIDGRALDEPRPTSIVPGFTTQALGSVLIATGRTRVICTASLEPRPPAWLERGGWVTAEYAMLPGSTSPRADRHPGGRGKEIQRLIGRSLRASLDLRKLIGPAGPVSLICDCDVIEADGGTRTASITGAWVALQLALRKLLAEGRIGEDPSLGPVAATSVGVVQLEGSAAPVALLDLCYREDSRAHVDLNVVMRGDAAGPGLIEVQGTGERASFSRAELDAMLDLAERGIRDAFELQRRALAGDGG
ncbi:ribonuclease PH [Nannocystaceae bacterium ST9]